MYTWKPRRYCNIASKDKSLNNTTLAKMFCMIPIDPYIPTYAKDLGERYRQMMMNLN
jgi:hypothetical protein